MTKNVIEVEKPKRCPFFEGKRVVAIACGGMHTAACGVDGECWTWGCNDDGALGRFGQENVPLRVDGALDIPVTDISTGDCHSVAYNTQQNTVFYWGCYKVSRTHFEFRQIFLN